MIQLRAAPRVLTLAAAVLGPALSLPSVARAQQSLALANGDQLTGQLARIDGPNWVFHYQGQDVSIPAGEVVMFTATEPIGIRLADTTIVAATVETVEGGLRLRSSDGTIRIVQPSDFAAVGAADDLQALEPIIIGLYSPFLKFWSFLGSAGGSFQRGNTDETNFAFTLDLSRETEKDLTQFTSFITLTKEYDDQGNVTKSEPKIIIGLGTDVFLIPSRLFAGVAMRWQHEPAKDLQFRQTYTGGIGYQFVRNDNTTLLARVGGGGRFDNLTTGEDSNTPILNLSGQFVQKAGPVRFGADISYNPSVQDFSDFELIDAYSIALTAIEGLTFKWTLLHELNNPPPSGDEKNDITMTFQLGWALGVK